MALLCNDVSYWLGTSLESALEARVWLDSEELGASQIGSQQPEKVPLTGAGAENPLICCHSNSHLGQCFRIKCPPESLLTLLVFVWPLYSWRKMSYFTWQKRLVMSFSSIPFHTISKFLDTFFHEFSFLNRSLGFDGGKHYQKITIPIFRLVLPNFAIAGCFLYILFYGYLFSLLSSGWFVIAVYGFISV